MARNDVPDDGTSIEAIAAEAAPPAPGLAGTGPLLLLFLVFIFVVSDVFVDNILVLAPGAVDGRSPTAYGVALQGVGLVGLYVAVQRLVEGGYV